MNNIENKMIKILNSIKNNNKKAMIFLMGFPHDYCRLPGICGFKFFGDKSWFNKNRYIDVNLLDKSKKSLLKMFLLNESDYTWGFYEEFIALTNLLNEVKSQYDGQIFIIDNNLFDKHYPIEIDKDELARLYSYFIDESKDDDTLALANYYSDVEIYQGDNYGISFINKHQDEDIKVIPFYEKRLDIEVNDKSIYNTKITAKDPNLFSMKSLLQNGEFNNPLEIIIDDEKDEDAIMPLVDFLQLAGITYNITKNIRFKEIIKDGGNKYLSFLRKYWGENSLFRNLQFYKNPNRSNELIELSQGHLINDIIEQCVKAINRSKDYSDIFITSPTGSGKSLLFQIPALYLHKIHNAVTIVITPLISLMVDQVNKLVDKGVSIVTYINSDITFDEKENRIEKIRNGEYSIIYMSPELLLSNNIENIIGERELGLLVIDEAHLVTTWGRDFRADYWFLGEYIDHLRRGNIEHNFPVLCLTATAVYNGTEDTVNDTILSLNLQKPKIYLGNVKRENIHFKINNINRKEIKGGFEDFKIESAKKTIEKSIDNGVKCIIYCPYTTQVDDIYNCLDEKYKKKVGKYYGSYGKFEKADSQNQFKSDGLSVMIATKAFGLGVDIDNIKEIYHLAPTGNLADYVQEIGRAARKKNTSGIAATDFTQSDLKYVMMLYGLSGMKQYQLKEMIRKLSSIYEKKRKRNMLMPPEIFSYLFTDRELENKVKSGLLLIEKDLYEKYKFQVLLVRAKSMFTKNFVNVPHSIEDRFLKDYKEYIRLVNDVQTRLQISTSKYFGDSIVSNTGNIYEVNMSEIWENYFNNMTFAQFKREFFEGDLFAYDKNEKLTPRLNIKLTYRKKFDTVCNEFINVLDKLEDLFRELKSEHSFFKKYQFKDKFKEYFPRISNNELPGIILDLFVADISRNVAFNVNQDPMKFIQVRRDANITDVEYRIMNSNYSILKNRFSSLLYSCEPGNDTDTYSTYIPILKNGKKNDLVYLAILMEIFGYATYEMLGGKNTEIFIRINDPSKLRRIANQKYQNFILTDIEKKKRRSQLVLKRFLSSNLEDKERWDIIESYFLGKDDIVDEYLGINE